MLGAESLGWWGGVKATKLPPLSFLKVCSAIALLVTLAESLFAENSVGVLFAWFLATVLLFALGLGPPPFLFFPFLFTLQLFSCLPHRLHRHLLLMILYRHFSFIRKPCDIRSVFIVIHDLLNCVGFLPLQQCNLLSFRHRDHLF